MSYLYFNPQQEGIISDLTLFYCGESSDEKRNSWGPGIRDVYGFYFVTEGEGYLTVDHREHHIKAGNFFIVPSKHRVAYRPSPENPWQYIFVAVNSSRMDAYLGRIGVSYKVPYREVSDQKLMLESFQEILYAKQCPNSQDFQALSGFYSVLSQLMESCDGIVIPKDNSNKQERYVKTAQDFIEKNYSQPISVEEVAAFVGINRKYLTRLFQQITADSPKHYLMNYRMEKARDLLVNSSLNIREVSHSVGYTDPLVFSKVFKKMVGTCPREFRNQAQQAQSE